MNIDEKLREMTVLKIQARKEKRNHKDPDTFIRDCFVNRTPQSYGCRIEKRYIEKNKMTKIKKKNHGDAMDGLEANEIKGSISDNGSFNIVQIRPHDIFDYYLVLFFEIASNGDVFQHFFKVPKSDMMTFRGVGRAHGTKESNVKNANVEYRLTVKKNDDNWNRLYQFYQVKKEF